MLSARERASACVKVLREVMAGNPFVAVYRPLDPYIVVYVAEPSCDPWTPVIHVEGFPVFVHRTGSIPPLKP